jgi:S-adenosylmethionine synthetase
MKEQLRFAEAVCEGHPDRLADAIADRIVEMAVARDPDSLVGVEVAVHRNVVFVDGRIACGLGVEFLQESDVEEAVRKVFRGAGYGPFVPEPSKLEVRFDLCLGPLEPEERVFRSVSDDQVIGVGYACRGERAGLVPLEQALARDFVKALETLRKEKLHGTLGPDGKVLVAVRGRRLAAVSVSIHHAEDAEWTALVEAVRGTCLAVADEYVAAGELEPPDDAVSWLFNGAGAFSVGGPLGDNGLSGKKLVAEAFGSAVPIGGGTTHGKDPHKPDVRAQRIARERAVDHVRAGALEATVWVVFRPGDEEPAFVEESVRWPAPGERSAA